MTGIASSLQGLINDEQIANSPILILGNKIDIPGACGEDEIRREFELYQVVTGPVSFCRGVDWKLVCNFSMMEYNIIQW